MDKLDHRKNAQNLLHTGDVHWIYLIGHHKPDSSCYEIQNVKNYVIRLERLNNATMACPGVDKLCSSLLFGWQSVFLHLVSFCFCNDCDNPWLHIVPSCVDFPIMLNDNCINVKVGHSREDVISVSKVKWSDNNPFLRQVCGFTSAIYFKVVYRFSITQITVDGHVLRIRSCERELSQMEGMRIDFERVLYGKQAERLVCFPKRN